MIAIFTLFTTAPITAISKAPRWSWKLRKWITWPNHHSLARQTFVSLRSGAEPPLPLLRKWDKIVSKFAASRSSIAINRASILSIRCSRTLSSVPCVQWSRVEVKCECNDGRVEWIDGIRVWILGSLPPAGWRECKLTTGEFWCWDIRPFIIKVGEPVRSSLSTPERDENVDLAFDSLRDPRFISSL